MILESRGVSRMRWSALVFAMLALGACDRSEIPASAACARSASHEVAWSHATAPDVITARAEGPSCGQAMLTLAARNANGDLLWVFAAPAYDMLAGGGPLDAAVSAEVMDAFLAGWADVSLMRAGALPHWAEGAAMPGEGAAPFAYAAQLPREAYEAARARDATMLCYAAALEASQCLIIDPASNAPSKLVAFGP
jgi:hypothetical protein